MKGLEYLRRKLAIKQGRAEIRYRYYEMKKFTPQPDPTIDIRLKNYLGVVGWCASAVDSLADRLVFRTFRHDDFGINEIFRANNADIFTDSAILGALITSCDFAYIYTGSGTIPKMRIIDGCNATGVMDLDTMLLSEGYAVLERDQETNLPMLEAYFTAEETQYYEHGRFAYSVPHRAGIPLLVPIVHRPDAKREFGRSRISRACMGYVDSALQTIRKSEVAAYFYSFPQRYALGFETDDGFDKWKASMTAMLTIGRDEDGNLPQLGQFQTQTMAPYTDHLKMFASLFAGETGLTLDDMGFVTSNPMSDDAIRSSHETLRIKVRAAQRSFGTSFRNIGYTAACLRDGVPYERTAFAGLEPVWEPVFEATASQLGVVGDAIYKINQAIPGYIGPDTVHDMTGIAPAEDTDERRADSGNPLGSYFGGVSASNDEGPEAGGTE